jgi:hypothetical protein
VTQAKHVVFLLEEPSARDLLEGLLPRLLPQVPKEISVHYLVFEGKQDLDKQLVRKLRGWLLPESAFVVLRDQDAALCTDVRESLTTLVAQSSRERTLVRVACRELESWVLGDWQAVATAYDKPHLSGLSMKANYRDPDQLVRPVEYLRRHLPEYQKRDGARRVGTLLDPSRNQSTSFRVFCSGVRTVTAEGLRKPTQS